MPSKIFLIYGFDSLEKWLQTSSKFKYINPVLIHTIEKFGETDYTYRFIVEVEE